MKKEQKEMSGECESLEFRKQLQRVVLIVIVMSF